MEEVNLLDFIKSCIRKRKIHWTYHVNMRMQKRFIARKKIIEAVESFEIIEKNPEDKYLPSYLLWAQHENDIFHVLVAVDNVNEQVIIITAYRPDDEKWESNYKKRRK